MAYDNRFPRPVCWQENAAVTLLTHMDRGGQERTVRNRTFRAIVVRGVRHDHRLPSLRPPFITRQSQYSST
jgi:hypothetical protein